MCCLLFGIFFTRLKTNEIETNTTKKVFEKHQIIFSKELNISISYCDFLNCTSSANIDAASGGAIHISHKLGSVSDVSLKNVAFFGCKSQICAGAFYARCNSFFMYHSCFCDCFSPNTQTYFVFTTDDHSSLAQLTAISAILKRTKFPNQSFLLSQFHGIINNKMNNFTNINIYGHNAFGNYRMFNDFSISYTTMTNSSGKSLVTLYHQVSPKNCRIFRTAIVHNSIKNGSVFFSSSPFQISNSVVSDNGGTISNIISTNMINIDGESFLNDQWSDIASFFYAKYINQNINTITCLKSFQKKNIQWKHRQASSISTLNMIGSMFATLIIIICLFIMYKIRKIINQRRIDIMSIPEAYRLDDVEFERQN